jgi:hypothetical protein
MKLEADFEISRDPSEYSKTRHYIKRTKDRVMVEDDAVEAVIEEGEVVKVDAFDGEDRRTVTLQGEYLFSTIEVVLGIDDTNLQTAYEVEA